MLKLKAQLRKSVLYLFRKIPWSYQDRYYYYRKFKRLPNIRNPKLFNEKILYRKFVTGDYVRYGILADKVLVRGYIAKTIGDEYLVPLLHETAQPVTLLGLKSLKNTVIKSNHGSGMVKIILDEPDDNQKQLLVKRCEEWLTRDFSLEAREIHYRYIKPRIMVEQYVGDGKFAAVDYKFHMFNKKDGNFEYVLQVIYNRCANSPLSMNFYVNNLTSCFYKIRDTGLDISNEQPILQKVLELSKKLASDFDYVRVDWYIHDGRVYFGELTFTPGAGMVTGLDQGLNELMGSMWLQEHQLDVMPRPPAEVTTLPVVLKKV